MRAITASDQFLVRHYWEQFKDGREIQQDAAQRVAELLGVSVDVALDVLNRGGATEGLDRLGVETYPDPPGQWREYSEAVEADRSGMGKASAGARPRRSLGSEFVRVALIAWTIGAVVLSLFLFYQAAIGAA